jgi:hypothetical protein
VDQSLIMVHGNHNISSHFLEMGSSISF